MDVLTNNTSSTPNREFKDGVFRMLFKNWEYFLELVNALLGTNYGPETPMEETTLASVLYRKYKNDISFLVDDRLIVFTEHQSTINPNIALRFLGYMWETYKPRVDPEKMLSSTKVKIPRPCFFVFYNGVDKLPKEQVVRLSDMFEPWPGSKNPPFTIDLEAAIYNINTNSHPDILHKSKMLAQYETFVELVREYEETYELGKAIEFAINECIKRGILAEFLKIHGAEVRNMLYAEIDEAKLRKYDREGYIEEGMEIGREMGVKMGIEKGRVDGIRQTAKTMKAKGMDVNTIAEITGLTVDDILHL